MLTNTERTAVWVQEYTPPLSLPLQRTESPVEAELKRQMLAKLKTKTQTKAKPTSERVCAMKEIGCDICLCEGL